MLRDTYRSSTEAAKKETKDLDLERSRFSQNGVVINDRDMQEPSVASFSEKLGWDLFNAKYGTNWDMFNAWQ